MGVGGVTMVTVIHTAVVMPTPTISVVEADIAHYALRPWPWIIVALCSIIVYPNLDAIMARFPGLDPSIVRDDDDRFDCRRLLRVGATGGGRAGRYGVTPGASGEVEPATRFFRLDRCFSGADRAVGRTVVEHLVPWRGTRRRWVCGAANAGGAKRKGGDVSNAVVQHRPLRAAAMAVDHRRTVLDHRVPESRRDHGEIPGTRPVDRAGRR